MDRHPDAYDRHWGGYDPPLREGYHPSEAEADYYAPPYHRPSPHHRASPYGGPSNHEPHSHRDPRYEQYHNMRSPAPYLSDPHSAHSPHHSAQRTPSVHGGRPDVGHGRGEYYADEYPPHSYEYSPRGPPSIQARARHPHHCTCSACLGIARRPSSLAAPSPHHYSAQPTHSSNSLAPHLPMTHSHHSDLGVSRRTSESTFVHQKRLVGRTPQPPFKVSPNQRGFEPDGLRVGERQSDEQIGEGLNFGMANREEDASQGASAGNGNKRPFRLIAPLPEEKKTGKGRGANGKVKGRHTLAPTMSGEMGSPNESEEEEPPQPDAETKRRRGRRLDPASSVAMFNYRKGIDIVFFRMVDALGLEVLNEIEELMREALGAQFVARMHLDFKDLCYLEDTYRRQTVFFSEFLCTLGAPGIITRRTGEILYLNDACCEVLKVDRNNVIDVNFLMFVHASKLKEFFSLSVVKLLNPDHADQIIVDTTLQRPNDGVLLPVRITLKVIRDIYFFPSLVVIMFHQFLGPETTSTPTTHVFPSTSLLVGVLEDEEDGLRPMDPNKNVHSEVRGTRRDCNMRGD